MFQVHKPEVPLAIESEAVPHSDFATLVIPDQQLEGLTEKQCLKSCNPMMLLLVRVTNFTLKCADTVQIIIRSINMNVLCLLWMAFLIVGH